MQCKCDNCGHECESALLKKSVHLEERLDFPIDDPRCNVPAGDCPKCGAFSYEIEKTDEVPETNQQFLVRMLNSSCPTGPLIEPFIIEALKHYAKRISETPAEQLDSPILSGKAWKATGEWLKAEIEKKYGQ